MRRLERQQASVPVTLRRLLQRCFRNAIGPARAAKVWGCNVSDALIVFKAWRQRQARVARAKNRPVRIVRNPHRMAVWPASYVGPRRGLPSYDRIEGAL